ncbi:MAG TPA: ATP-binding protein [Chitinophagaceae bacterium]|nr:ATP-binding protein [Chitinophagaceae bacterium]
MASPENVVRILIIDDDKDDFIITGDYIRDIDPAGFQIDWCFNYNEALMIMKRREYDLYLVDYRLGAKTGLDLIKDARKEECEEPIVLLTGKGNRSIDREAMQAGAADYLIKTDLSTEKLERCIRYSMGRAASIKALKTNERKYRSIFERSKDAVFLADEQLKFIDINTATLELFEYNLKEIMELSLYDLMMYDEDKDKLKQQIATAGEVDDMEIEFVTKEQERKYCILSVSKEAVNMKSYMFYHGIIHDITHIKKAEKITLQVEKLAAAGRLVRTLAHEVRNPLNNINLSVDQLQQEIEEETQNRIYLDIIQRNSQRIGALITELLDTSRPAEMFMEKRSLQEILDESIAAALDRIILQKVKLKVKYTPEPAMILADKEKLKIAFLNIIINAVEAMQATEEQLEIIIETQNQTHTVHIKDRGCGISEENLSRLFEPYFTSKRNGLGLGLAATLNILQSHKANIEVNSTVNQGTSFIITFTAI